MNSITFITYFLTLLIGILLCSCQNVTGQHTIGDTDIVPYTLDGNISLQTNAYTTTAEFNRREPLSGILDGNLQYSFMGFSSGIDVYYNTDDNRFRQNMNRIAFNGSWRWIALSAGDVTPNYSEYGVRGTKIRGGELRLTPGGVFLHASAGRINRAVSEIDPDRPRPLAYERWLYAFAFGAGNPATTNIGLSGFYGHDLQSSLPDLLRASLNEGLVGTQIMAAENYGLTPRFQLSLFDELLKFGAEATVSAFTRDQNSPLITVEDSDVPGFLIDLFTPRNSTRISYAGKAHGLLTLDYFSLRADFERIMPGFESIAIRQLRDDQQTISLAPRFNFLNGRLNMDASLTLSEDNLLGTRLSTQKRTNIGGNIIARLSEVFTLGGGYTRFQTYTESEDIPAGQRDHEQVSQIFQLFPSIVFYRGSASHNISVSGIYQDIDVSFLTAQGMSVNKSHTITGAISHGVSFAGGLSVNSSVNYVTGESPGSKFTTIGASLGGGYALLEGRLNTNLTLSLNMNRIESETVFDRIVTESAQLNGNFTATYRLTSNSRFQFNLRSNNNSMRQGDGLEFSELEARLRFQQRF